jgi:broad specificity phosphatase PhoE
MIFDFYIFRHGQTDWNAQRRMQGHRDIPLNSIGQDQAKELIKSFKDLSPEIIYSSDLLRAKETATILNQSLKLPIHFTPDLREAHIGEAEAMIIEELEERFGKDTWEKWKAPAAENDTFRFPKGESRIETFNRVKKFIDIIIEKKQETKIVISTHGFALYLLLLHISNDRTFEASIPNSKVFKFKYNSENLEWTLPSEFFP